MSSPNYWNFAANTRIADLEFELKLAAEALAKAHPIAEVKHIGIREVAAATADVVDELIEARAAADRLKALDETLSALRYDGWSIYLMYHPAGEKWFCQVIDVRETKDAPRPSRSAFGPTIAEAVQTIKKNVDFADGGNDT